MTQHALHVCAWVCFSLNDIIKQWGRSAVIEAAMGGHTHTVDALMAGGADINIQDEVS